MEKKVIAAMTALAVYEIASSQSETSSPITVSYVLYDDGEVKKFGPESRHYTNMIYSVEWPFTEEEARILLQAKANGLLFESNNKTVE